MILDIIFFVLILIFTVLGAVRGFYKTLASFLSGMICLLLAYLLAKVVANAFLSENMAKLIMGDNSLFGKIYGIMPDGLKEIKMDPIRTAVARGEDMNGIYQQIASQTDGLFALFTSLIRSAVVKEIYLDSAIDNVAQVLSLELTYHIYVILVGVAIYIVLRIIVMGVNILAMRSRTGKAVELVQRLTGLALGAVRGFVYACLIVVFASYISGVSEKIREQVDSSAVGRPVAEWASQMTSGMLSGDIESNDRYLLLIKELERKTEEAQT